jgi:hypothetical protein
VDQDIGRESKLDVEEKCYPTKIPHGVAMDDSLDETVLACDCWIPPRLLQITGIERLVGSSSLSRLRYDLEREALAMLQQCHLPFSSVFGDLRILE